MRHRPEPYRRCIRCGCTDDNACVDPVTGVPCHWISLDPPVCSACACDGLALDVPLVGAAGGEG